jgi:hypothetical protein
MRINQFWKVHKWLPVVRAMGRMLPELYRQPSLGLLHHEMWFGRTLILVQYWRSMDQLMDYAKARDSQHLPAWQAFNKAIGNDGSVGIWHETTKPGRAPVKTSHVNMPPFGMGKAGTLVPAKGGLQSAKGRLSGG